MSFKNDRVQIQAHRDGSCSVTFNSNAAAWLAVNNSLNEAKKTLDQARLAGKSDSVISLYEDIVNDWREALAYINVFTE